MVDILIDFPMPRLDMEAELTCWRLGALVEIG
jgi:hypothetical protein